MGWQDRDYAKPGSQGPFVGGPTIGGTLRRWPVWKLLIAVNVVVYFLCSMTSQGGQVSQSPIFVFGAMVTPYVQKGQIWRLVTSDYLHWNMWHIGVNMLGLYFLGRPLEDVWGRKKFFIVYSLAGILGSLFYMLLNMIGWLQLGVAAGASGCILGLLGAAAIMFPHAQVWVYFLFPVKIRTAAIVMGLGYAYSVLFSTKNAGGNACHLVGLVFGVWWAMKGDRWWSRLASSRRAHVVRQPGFHERVTRRRADAELIDKILTKVHTTGMASLSDQEKRSLIEATRRQQAEDRHYGLD
jgi:rhomboid family protein